ncbi:MAG: hypothetical protein LBN05_02630 [Oscillospiraceae bacterium]|jgi:hypothetical protein|nr:hypothetical protein [Oscillospiraceae bacterium]
MAQVSLRQYYYATGYDYPGYKFVGVSKTNSDTTHVHPFIEHLGSWTDYDGPFVQGEFSASGDLYQLAWVKPAANTGYERPLNFYHIYECADDLRPEHFLAPTKSVAVYEATQSELPDALFNEQPSFQEALKGTDEAKLRTLLRTVLYNVYEGQTGYAIRILGKTVLELMNAAPEIMGQIYTLLPQKQRLGVSFISNSDGEHLPSFTFCFTNKPGSLKAARTLKWEAPTPPPLTDLTALWEDWLADLIRDEKWDDYNKAVASLFATNAKSYDHAVFLLAASFDEAMLAKMDETIALTAMKQAHQLCLASAGLDTKELFEAFKKCAEKLITPAVVTAFEQELRADLTHTPTPALWSRQFVLLTKLVQKKWDVPDLEGLQKFATARAPEKYNKELQKLIASTVESSAPIQPKNVSIIQRSTKSKKKAPASTLKVSVAQPTVALGTQQEQEATTMNNAQTNSVDESQEPKRRKELAIWRIATVAAVLVCIASTIFSLFRANAYKEQINKLNAGNVVLQQQVSLARESNTPIEPTSSLRNPILEKALNDTTFKVGDALPLVGEVQQASSSPTPIELIEVKILGPEKKDFSQKISVEQYSYTLATLVEKDKVPTLKTAGTYHMYIYLYGKEARIGEKSYEFTVR